MITDVTKSTNGGEKAAEGYLDAKTQKAAVEVSPEVKERAAYFIENYKSYLKERTEAYVQRMADLKAHGPSVELGGPITALGYQYWNVLTLGPFQLIGDPPWRPSRIIAAGEPALILGVVWVNPSPDPGGGVPGTVVLSGRDYRVRFETINLSTVQQGMEDLFIDQFPPVPSIHLFPFLFIAPDPGPNPRLYQTYMTADVINPAQPFAAFATWHFDPDTEPGFLGLPNQPGGWEHERPCTYLVYRE